MKTKKINKINKKQFYFFIISCCAVLTVVICILAYYMIGVFERASMNRILERRIEKVSIALETNMSEQAAIMDIMADETLAKAKSLSLMLLHTSLSDGTTFELIEETRISLNVSGFYITDENGIVVIGTDAYVGDMITDLFPDTNFLDAIENKSYSSVIRPDSGLDSHVIAAVSRMDKKGVVVVVTYSSDAPKKALELAGISNVTLAYPIFKNGTTSIVDIESYTYLSHTNEGYIGQRLQIPVKKFKNIDDTDGSGYFTIRLEGKKQYIYYEVYDNYLLTANVPSSEMFARRNFTVGALIIVCPLICLVIILAARNSLIKQKMWE